MYMYVFSSVCDEPFTHEGWTETWVALVFAGKGQRVRGKGERVGERERVVARELVYSRGIE